MTVNKINLISLNTHGFKGNALYIKNVVKQNDIIFISEHWISKFETFLLEDISTTHSLITHDAQENLSGRPFGGHCFFIRKTISKTMKQYMRMTTHLL